MATMRHEPWCDNLDQVKKQIVTATICPESRSRLTRDKMSQRHATLCHLQKHMC